MGKRERKGGLLGGGTAPGEFPILKADPLDTGLQCLTQMSVVALIQPFHQRVWPSGQRVAHQKLPDEPSPQLGGHSAVGIQDGPCGGLCGDHQDQVVVQFLRRGVVRQLGITREKTLGTVISPSFFMDFTLSQAVWDVNIRVGAAERGQEKWS